MLTQAPDPLPTTHRKHMLSHSGSNTRDSSQINYFCMCMSTVCVCYMEKRGMCVHVCLSVWKECIHSDFSEQNLQVPLKIWHGISLSVFHSLTHTHLHTHVEEHTWGIPGHCVIGLNDLRNNKRPFSFLVWLSFAASLINSHRKSLKAKIRPDRSTAAEKVPKTRK